MSTVCKFQFTKTSEHGYPLKFVSANFAETSNGKDSLCLTFQDLYGTYSLEENHNNAFERIDIEVKEEVISSCMDKITNKCWYSFSAKPRDMKSVVTLRDDKSKSPHQGTAFYDMDSKEVRLFCNWRVTNFLVHDDIFVLANSDNYVVIYEPKTKQSKIIYRSFNRVRVVRVSDKTNYRDFLAFYENLNKKEQIVLVDMKTLEKTYVPFHILSDEMFLSVDVVYKNSILYIFVLFEKGTGNRLDVFVENATKLLSQNLPKKVGILSLQNTTFVRKIGGQRVFNLQVLPDANLLIFKGAFLCKPIKLYAMRLDYVLEM